MKKFYLSPIRFVRKVYCSIMHKYTLWSARRHQTTFCYCPECGLELCWNGKVLDDADGVVKFECPNCLKVSVWDFCYPSPLLLNCDQCVNKKRTKSGRYTCSEICCPWTMSKFTLEKE